MIHHNYGIPTMMMRIALFLIASILPVRTEAASRVKTTQRGEMAAPSSDVPNYLPEIPGAEVIIPTLAPPPPPTLDVIYDIQPMDTAMGDLIQKQFVTQPMKTAAVPTQAAIDLAYGCPATSLPKIVGIQAPSGCSQSHRTGMVRNSTGTAKLSWSEKCFDFGTADMLLTHTGTGDLVSQLKTRPTAFTNIIDLTDCNGKVMYSVHEHVSHMVDDKLQACSGWGGNKCEGDTYLQWQIVSMMNEVVAVTPYIPIFANQITLFDPKSGKKIAHMIKNGEWTPATRCPSFEKNWYVSFEDPSSAAAAGSGITSTDKRWVTVAFASAMAMRDEDRSQDGSVSFSLCQKESLMAVIVLLVLVAAVAALFVFLWIKMYWCQALIRFFAKVQNNMMPKAIHKPAKWNLFE